MMEDGPHEGQATRWREVRLVEVGGAPPVTIDGAATMQHRNQQQLGPHMRGFDAGSMTALGGGSRMYNISRHRTRGPSTRTPTFISINVNNVNR